jgi:archaeal flagellin FlaB
VTKTKKLFLENAFTGLEAAIVLIAFIVVAAVFSYVILGAGFFTSQTAQKAIHTSVDQASSSLELSGSVLGIRDAGSAHNYLDYVNMTVTLTAGGTSVDLSQMVVSYNDNNGSRITNMTYGGIASDGGTCPKTDGSASTTWCIGEEINNQSASAMLETNEEMILMIGLPATATPDTAFTINLQPAVGAYLPVSRTVPASLDCVQALD